VAASLTVELVPKPAKRIDCVAPRDTRESRQTATSTTSSVIDGGIASPRSLKLST
jgi:hypothetical protein